MAHRYDDAKDGRRAVSGVEFGSHILACSYPASAKAVADVGCKKG